jgi:Zn-dependent peptidase ImmA (M78 family)
LDLSRLEWQAHSFAGLVLVPGDALERVVRDVIRQVKTQGINHERDFAHDLVLDMVATRFGVSAEVIQRRLDYDRLDPWS